MSAEPLTTPPMLGDVVLDVLGRERVISRVYPDSSFDCPFCTSPVVAPATRDSNPWCSASRYAVSNLGSADAFRVRIAADEARQREADDRARNHAAAMDRLREDHARHQAWEREQVAEARRRGACLRCLFVSGWERVRFTRHRGECPRERRSA